MFERSDLVPLVRREDYDAAVVAEVMRDEDAETLQFVVRAAPVAEGQVAAVLTAEITGLQQAVRMLRAQLAQAQRRGRASKRPGATPRRERRTRRGRAPCPRRSGSPRWKAITATRSSSPKPRAPSATRPLPLRSAPRPSWKRCGAMPPSGKRRAAADAAARIEWQRVRAESIERERELAAAAERAAAEAESLRAELVRRDAAVASSAAALAELRANYDFAVAAIEPLRAELMRVQRLADTFAAERDAALTRTDAAEAELGRRECGGGRVAREPARRARPAGRRWSAS